MVEVVAPNVWRKIPVMRVPFPGFEVDLEDPQPEGGQLRKFDGLNSTERVWASRSVAVLRVDMAADCNNELCKRNTDSLKSK